MNSKLRTGSAPGTEPTSSRRARMLLAALLLLLLLGGGAGLFLYLRKGSGDGGNVNKDGPPSRDDKPDPGRVTSCSDTSDPKHLEPLEFGEPIEVPFKRNFFDALKDKPIPPVEIYPWQPEGLVAVFGEHRMRGPVVAAHPDG